jgi:hypothetical protein
MEDNSFVRLLEETFLNGDPDYGSKQQGCYEPAGIRLVQIYRGVRHPRMNDLWKSKPWKLKGNRYVDHVLGKVHPTRWDMTTDGLLLSFCHSSCLFYLFEVEPLDEHQLAWAINPPMSNAEVISQRLDLVIVLGTVLVKNNMPMDKLSTGELETEHRAHLQLIQRATYRHHLHIPPYKANDWLRDRAVSGEGISEWNITLDGRIAYCRVANEGYHVFLIEPLAEEQVAYYKKKYGVRDHIDDLGDAVKNYTDEQGIEMLEFLQLLLAELKKEEQE